ncbi:ribonuclease H2 subunit B-like isoform X2 [Liolophura sinensis]
MPPRRSRNSVKTEPEEADVDKKVPASSGHCKDEQSQWVMVTDDTALDCDPNNENSPVFVRLKHPKTEQGALFLFTHGDSSVYEVNKFTEKYRSWLIDDTVQADGSILLVTPADPVYLVLPYLIASAQSGKYMTLDQIVVDENFSECRRLLSCSGLSELSNVADIKGDDDLKVFRYNKEKTLSWLKLKVEKVVDRLQQRNVLIGSVGQSATYVRSLKEQSVTEDDYRRYACGLVSDYLPLELSSLLVDYLDIPVKPDPSPVEEPPSKKVKLEPADLNPTEDYSKGQKKLDNKMQKNGSMTAGQKKLLSVDKTGMKNISSFFSPKSKT